MSIPERLDEIQTRADAATAGPWEYGDRYHIQGASHCKCSPEYGPLVADKPMDINGEMMRAHVHKRDEPFWPHGIYSPTDEGPLAVVYDGDGRGLDEQDAEFIAHARADVPWLIEQVRKREAALRAVLDVCDREIAEPWSPGSERLAITARRMVEAALGEVRP